MTVVEAEAAAGFVRPAGSAETRWSGATASRFLASGDETAGTYCLVDETAHLGETVPLHRHVDDWESIYVVEGELSIWLGDLRHRAAAGSFAYIPAGAVHGFRVETETARYLLLTTPQHGEFYRAISFPAGPGGAPPGRSADDAMIGAACERFNIDFLGPLPASD